MKKLTIDLAEDDLDRIYDWVESWRGVDKNYVILAEVDVVGGTLKMRGWSGQRANEIYNIFAPAYKQVIATEPAREPDTMQMSLTE